MTLPNGFSEADRDKLARELLKLRADAKKRATAAARKKREAGLVTVTQWVPKDRVEEFKSICKNALTKFASEAAITAMPQGAREAAEQHHPEHMRNHHQ